MTPLHGRTETRGLRPLPRAPLAARRRPRDRPAAARRLPPGAARPDPLPRRRPDRRRGLHPRLVPAEPDVRGRGDLLRLPRAAQPEAARRGQCRLQPVPPAERVRRGRAPSSTPGPAGQPVRRLPHAGQDLHGGRPAPRSRVPRAAARPRRPHRRARRLHRLPCGQGCDLGRGPHRASGTVRPDAARRSSARRWRRTARAARRGAAS